MFVADSDIQVLMAAALKKATFADLPNYWTNIIQRAHQAAYNEIYMALVRRGFSPAQIAAWDSGPEYELFLSCWWSCVFGGGFHAYDPTWIRELDRRKNQLPTVEVSNAGVWQPPGIAPPAGPGQAYSAAQERFNFGFGPLPGGCYGWDNESNPNCGNW
jgi:hypothetical protein